MDVSRLHGTLTDLAAEIAQSKIIEHLQALKTAIEAAITQNTPEATTAVRERYQQIINSLSEAKSNAALPTQRLIIHEIGAGRFFGAELLERIQTIVGTINMTPQGTVTQLQALWDETNAYYGLLNRARQDFAALKLELDDRAPGLAELAVSIPREAFEPTSANFEKELKKLNYILDTFNEIATNNAEEIRIKRVSSSDWQFYIQCALNVLLLFPIAAEKIIDLLNKYVDYKKKLEELERGGFPEEVMKPIKDHLEKYLPAERKRIAEEIVAAHAKTQDQGRKNELVARMNITLTHIIDFRARGTSFEIRAIAPEPPKAKEDGTPANEADLVLYETKRQQIEDLNARGRAMTSLVAPKDATLLPPPEETTEK